MTKTPIAWKPVTDRRLETVLADGRTALVDQKPSGEWGWGIRSGSHCLDDDSGYDTYATAWDAMRAVLHPEDAASDRGEGFGRAPRTGLAYGR